VVAVIVGMSLPHMSLWAQGETQAYGIGISVSDTSPGVNSPVLLTATVTDAGVPQAGIPVSATVEFPDRPPLVLPPADTDGSGKAAFEFYTSTMAGHNNITVSAGSGRAFLSLLTSPGEPANITILPVGNVLSIGGTSALLPSDGVHGLQVVSRLADQYGNPVDNASVTMYNATGIPYAFTTNADGVAGPVRMGPSMVPRTETAAASYGTLPAASYEVDFAACEFTAGVSESMVAVGTNVTATATVKVNGSCYAGIPVTFRLYYVPGGAPVDVSTIPTDGTGTAAMVEPVANESGNNYIVASVDELGLSRTLTVVGINGTPASLIVSATAVGNYDASGKALADSTSYYDVVARLVDAYGNPIEGVNVNFSDDDGNMWAVTTNGLGNAIINSASSNAVRGMVLTISAENYCCKDVTLDFVAGPARVIFVRANPNVIAASNVSDEGMPYDPHATNVSAIVMDDWYHPLANHTVTFSLANGSIGSFSSITGTTDSAGTFISVFTLNHTSPDSALVPNGSLYGTVPVGARFTAPGGEVVSSATSIIYTYDSFLSVETDIRPMNATLNRPINVSVNVTGVGWAVQPMSADVFLVADVSGSMNYYSDVAQSSTGTIPEDTWARVGTFYLDNATVKSFDIAFSWDYNNPESYGAYDSRNTYYLLAVGLPDNRTIIKQSGTTPGFPSGFPPYTYQARMEPGYVKTQTTFMVDDVDNVNDWRNSYNIYDLPYSIYHDRLPSGEYTIYAYYHEGPAGGPSPYYLWVETETHRIDAMKDAAKAFVADVASYDRVGLVKYSDSATLVSSLTPMNTAGRSSLTTKIDRLAAGGATHTDEALKKAIDNIVQNSRDPKVKRYILLVTDGYSYDPAGDLYQAGRARDNNIVIFTVGIGGADEGTLSTIASMTKGSYYHASNKTDLISRFKDLAQYMHETVAEQSSITLVSDTTAVNGTFCNTTEYVERSGWVKPNQNSSARQVEPLISNATDGYALTWYPGKITVGQKWCLSYQLMVLHTGPDGVITPITNDSFIWFIRDGQQFNVTLDTYPVFVSNNTTGMGDSDIIRANITYPAPGLNVTDNIIDLKWKVWYNGTGWYNQTLYYAFESGPFVKIADLPGWDNSTSPRYYDHMWDVTEMRPGNYTVKVRAYDTTGHEALSNATFRRPDLYGKIILS